MDFFKSVFSADLTSPPQHKSPPDSPRHSPDPDEQEGSGSVGDGGVGGHWRGLIKTFATRSESMIQTYRRDLEEFGSGLKKETTAFREAAARAVLDLPGSLEAGTSVAQESLESVGQAIDDFGGSVWRGTTEIISQGKEAILSMEAETGRTDQYPPQNENPSSRRYSRFDAQVLAIQSDVNTFSEGPEDAEDFNNWRSGFELAEKEDEIEKLCYENGALEGFLEKLVPGLVDYETFWCRYYYRVHKLKQAEDARAKLVKRVMIAGEEEEDLSWEVDDDGENEDLKKDEKKEEKLRENKGAEVEEKKGEIRKEMQKEDMDSEAVGVEKHTKVSQVENSDASTAKIDEGVILDAGKTDGTKKGMQKEDLSTETVGVEKHTKVSQVENSDASTAKIDEGVILDAGKTDGTKKGMQKEDLSTETVGVEKHAETSQVDNSEASTAKIDEGVALDAGKREIPEFTGGRMNLKSDDKTVQQGKMEAIGSCKDSSISIVSSQPSVQEEEDLEWDEIENLGEHDEKKPGDTAVSPLDLHNRISAIEDDEDLSWDIEDDDEPIKP